MTDPSAASAGPVPDDLADLLAPLEGLEERPVAEHVAAFEQVHGRLRTALAGEATPRA